MKIQDILSEGISDIVYHYTPINNLYKIISADQFHLTATFSNPADLETGNKRLFFMSVTRSLTGSYTKSDNGSCVMVLDGKKLSHNYTGEPVNYWKGVDVKYDEMEDRIYHKEPEIPNATRYIKAVHIYFDEPINANSRTTLIAVKKANIPLYLYNDKQAFLRQNTRKAKSLKDFELTKDRTVDFNGSYKAHQANKERVNIKQGKAPIGIDAWNIFINAPTSQYGTMHPELKTNLNRVLSYGTAAETRTLQAELHNNKNNNVVLKKFSQTMNQHNLKSVDDIVKFVQNKWKDEFLKGRQKEQQELEARIRANSN